MLSIYNILVLLVVIQCSASSYGNPLQKFFRNDYTYLDRTDSFYKIHTARRTWDDAKTRCELEGATLFYPEDEIEAAEVVHFWKQTHSTIDSVFIGIRAFYANQAFLTLDRARSVRDVYSNWASGEPNNHYVDSACVILNNNGYLNDAQCQTRRPFICKKRLEDVEWSQDCHRYDSGYVYSESTGQCYKFHTTPRNWSEAVDACYAEQSYLAIIDDENEANYLSRFASADHGQGNQHVEFSNVLFLGFRREIGRIFMTIKGAIIDRDSNKWNNGEPSDGHDEECGSMFINNGRLNDQTCHPRLYYVCEHDIKLVPQPDENVPEPVEPLPETTSEFSLETVGVADLDPLTESPSK